MAQTQAIAHFEKVQAETRSWFLKEIAGLRSGRITPEMVSSLPVEHYGSRNQLNALASVSSLDARTLLISPWDKSAVAAIEKAIIEANIGVFPTVDGSVIRLNFPSPTQEVREQTIRHLHKKGEEARVRLRVGRDEALKIIKVVKENGEMSEDDFYAGKEKLDQLIATANETVASGIKKKEAEIEAI